MAIKKSITEYGITFPEAYFKIEGYQVSEGRVEDGVKYYIANVNVSCYTDSTKAYKLQLNQMLPSKPRQDFTEEDNNIASMYEWIKTLPELEGAIDA